MAFKTSLEGTSQEIVVEKSRFIAHVQPVTSEKDAQLFIETIKKKHYSAAHNVPVYRIGEEGYIQKFSDDGEPAGTAGLPVLDLLKKEGITNICIVITRYFGGIKLGTGGLVRAYTASAKEALSAVKIHEIQAFIIGEIDMDYTWYTTIAHTLEHLQVPIVETLYGEGVYMTVASETSQWTKLCETIVEKSNGNLALNKVEETYGMIDNHRFVKYPYLQQD